MKKLKNKLNLSVIKGEKLFNNYTPFVINIIYPESDNFEKKSNADIICVIDISGSMSGTKIELVKKSLNILVEMMDKNDRLAIVLFNEYSNRYLDLKYLTKENKQNFTNKITEIKATGGTDILSGLKEAVDILENDKEKINPNRASSIILLSDGCDNNLDDIQLGEELKKLTKGKHLNFTLNTFGYGNDHDAKVMKKLASIRDGSFFFVEKYQDVAGFFGVTLGKCVSVVSNKASLVVELLNKSSNIIKIFGEEYLYNHELTPKYFTMTMLQFLYGKEFTYVLEIDLNNVQIGEELLVVDFLYPDEENNFIKKTVKYKYQLTDIDHSKANNEYIRCQVSFIMEKALKLKENYRNDEAKKILNEMKDWLMKNNIDNKRNIFLEDINDTLNYFKDEKIFEEKGKYEVINRAMEHTTKKQSSAKSTYSTIRERYYYDVSTRRLSHKEKYKSEKIKINKKKGSKLSQFLSLFGKRK